MKLGDYKLIFIVVGLIGVLLIASPPLLNVIRLPAGEHFSEIYLLGPGHMAQDYPYNVVTGQNYSLYVGVTNNLGSSAYYLLLVKLKNQTDLYPNDTTGTPSSLPPLYEYRFVIQDGQSWESLLTFSLFNTIFLNNQSLVQTLMINNSVFSVHKSAAWDATATAFKYQLLFELWIYNTQTGSFEYNSRYVDLQLNLTET